MTLSDSGSLFISDNDDDIRIDDSDDLYNMTEKNPCYIGDTEMTTTRIAALMTFTVITRLVPIKWEMASFMMTQTLLYVQGIEWNELKKEESIKRVTSSNLGSLFVPDSDDDIKIDDSDDLYNMTEHNPCYIGDTKGDRDDNDEDSNVDEI